MKKGKQIKRSAAFCFAILVRLPVGITSLKQDGESLSQLPFVEQFLFEEVTRMANKNLFASMLSRLPRANAANEAGGRAYKLEPKHALAQVAATGTFGNAFYSTAETQLAEVLKLIDEVDDNQYLAKLALYAREKAFMKDMPAALLVALSVRDTEIMHRVFDRVADNGRVLRTVSLTFAERKTTIGWTMFQIHTQCLRTHLAS